MAMKTTADRAEQLLSRPDIYRNGELIRKLAEKIGETAAGPVSIMEVCGGQTYALARYRLEEFLPESVKMIHGPGCPVCVTPASVIDMAVDLAGRENVTLCSFGDMLRVPGSRSSLLRAKAAGADVRILYSPLDALTLARETPGREIVFLAIGFETTTPGYALMIEKAERAGIGNLSLLTSLYTVPAAVRALKKDPECQIDVLLAAGHVCAVTGTRPYESMARELKMPTVVTGFEPVDLMRGILTGLEMAAKQDYSVANDYGRVVAAAGNPTAMKKIEKYFQPTATKWRGLGVILQSGMKIRKSYEHFDAAVRFNLAETYDQAEEHTTGCIAHRIMKGLALPGDCAHFGHDCTPLRPIGAPMVSSEGVCAAHHRYRP